MSAVEGTVGDDHLADALLVKMAGGEFDGFAGADQKRGLILQIVENALGQADGGKGYGYRAGADGGVGAYLFCRGKSVLEQSAESFAQGAGFGRGLVGCLHLSEDLRFAEDHRIQPAGNAEHVSDGVGILVGVKIGMEFFPQEAPLTCNPVDERFRVGAVDAAIEFRAVAGGQNGRLLDFGQADQGTQRRRQAFSRESKSLPYGNRCTVVVQTQGKDGH